MTHSPLPTTRRGWQRLIADLNLRPSKGRGQNFLHDISVVHQIVKTADIRDADHVLEIGPGLGILTAELLAKAASVTAIEIDTLLADHLRQALGPNPAFRLIQDDALKVDLGRLFDISPLKVVANLPYSVGAAIIQHVLEADVNLVSATVMVQREVGERLVASPPDMSILSVATQSFAHGHIAFVVPPDVFLPPPTVESVVVHLVPHPGPLIDAGDRPGYFALVNAGFRHKRKNIANSLEIETRLPKAEIADLLRQSGIDPTRRAQTLSVAEWIALHRVWGRAHA